MIISYTLRRDVPKSRLNFNHKDKNRLSVRHNVCFKRNEGKDLERSNVIALNSTKDFVDPREICDPTVDFRRF